VRDQARLDRDFDDARGIVLAQVGDDLGGELAQRDLAALDVRACDLGEPEQAVDQHRHVLRGAANPIEHPDGLGIESRIVILLDRVREPVDRAQWRAQIVCDRIAERFELVVRDLELARALADPRFELRVQARIVDREPGTVGEIREHHRVGLVVAAAATGAKQRERADHRIVRADRHDDVAAHVESLDDRTELRFEPTKERSAVDLGHELRLAGADHVGGDRRAGPDGQAERCDVGTVVDLELGIDVRVRRVDDEVTVDERDQASVADQIRTGPRDLREQRCVVGSDAGKLLRDRGKHGQPIARQHLRPIVAPSCRTSS